MSAMETQKAAEDSPKKKKTKTTRVNLLWYKDSWLSFPALEINKSFLILNKAKSFWNNNTFTDQAWGQDVRILAFFSGQYLAILPSRLVNNT